MLGIRIKELRERHDFSLEDLASRSGVPVNILISLEKGEIKSLDNRDLVKVADCLHLNSIYDYAYLFCLNTSIQRFKAYCVGLPKTGTTSIAGLLTYYRSAHEYDFKETVKEVMAFEKGEITYQHYRNYLMKRDVEAFLEMDSASFNHYFLDVLKNEFGAAKFIFTIRDCYSWVNSVINMYLRGDPVRGYDRTSGQWMDEYTEFLFGVKKTIIQNRKKLHHSLNDCIEKLLWCWSTKNKQILSQLPSNRSIIIKTNEISNKIDELANFLCISPDTINKKKTHLYKTNHEMNILEEVDKNFIKEMSEKYCVPLMQEIFSGYSLGDYYSDLNK